MTIKQYPKIHLWTAHIITHRPGKQTPRRLQPFFTASQLQRDSVSTSNSEVIPGTPLQAASCINFNVSQLWESPANFQQQLGILLRVKTFSHGSHHILYNLCHVSMSAASIQKLSASLFLRLWSQNCLTNHWVNHQPFRRSKNPSKPHWCPRIWPNFLHGPSHWSELFSCSSHLSQPVRSSSDSSAHTFGPGWVTSVIKHGWKIHLL